MSRWIKGRSQGNVVPLESLIKEKENTNRPSLARTAGTVGKWGVTSFTSIRSSYGINNLSSYSPRQESANCSPQSGEFQVTSSGPTTPDPPKPRKFFKSRNTAPESLFKLFPQVQSPQQNLSPLTPTRDDQIHYPANKPQKQKKVKPPKKVVVKSTKTVADVSAAPIDNANKRTSSRTRNKVVNYNEDDEDMIPEKLAISKEKVISSDIQTRTNVEDAENESGFNTKTNEMSIQTVPTLKIKDLQSPTPTSSLKSKDNFSTTSLLQSSKDLLTISTQKAVLDHPPIVLRISKGTSRLISTDSEDVTFSPPHINNTVLSGLSSAAELLAVLSDDPEVGVPPQLPICEIEEPKPESIKIKIKTSALDNNTKVGKHSKHKHHKKKFNATAAVIAEAPNLLDKENANELKPEFEPESLNNSTAISALPNRVTRASRRQQNNTDSEPIPSALLPPPVKCASPLPGTDNYDLYRSLASPSDKDFDSQSSVLGSLSSKETTFAVGVPEDSRVIHSRGSSDPTSDIETSQSSILAAPPSDLNVSIDALFETDETVDCKNPQLINTVPEEPIEPIITEFPEKSSTSAAGNKRVTRRAMKSPPITVIEAPPVPPIQLKSSGRITRNNNSNGTIISESAKSNNNVKSYTRKRRIAQTMDENNSPATTNAPLTSPAAAIVTSPSSQATVISSNFDQNSLPNTNSNSSNNNWSVVTNKLSEPEANEPVDYKVKTKSKKCWYDQDIHSDSSSQEKDIQDPSVNIADPQIAAIQASDNVSQEVEENDKPSVKLLISKKKGSIFRSRALLTDKDSNKKRHVYKHQWDDESKDKAGHSNNVVKSSGPDPFDDEFDGETSTAATRLIRQNTNSHDTDAAQESTSNERKEKSFLTVRNVKKAHQIQEIGEFQEMVDDVEYLLDALQPHNPLSTRCLSAIQLAQKCMIPAFRMHVRAHGTVPKFFSALNDATKSQSLGLCTATVMFVLSQDNLNMDLERNSLELMLNILKSDISKSNVLVDCGLTLQQNQKHLQKVKELCEEIKNQGKAAYLNLENITVGTLAMETLLSLTPKRAGEWFKEELRNLGGVEHIIKTICECCHQISDYVVDWTDVLLEKLRTIERCLRVLENVTQNNEKNQAYILLYHNGNTLDTLVKLYKLCDSEIALYPTTSLTAKDSPGFVIREALVPTLKVLINLSHPFNEKAIGSVTLGDQSGIFDTSLHLLLLAPNYIPEQNVFELSILVLLLLINLTTHTISNRKIIMEAYAPTDGNKFVREPAIKALVKYFDTCDEMAKQDEQKTDAILDHNPNKAERKGQSQEEVQETVSKLLQKAGHHMEHTMLQSHVSILIGYLVMGNEQYENVIRPHLRNGDFQEMIKVLEKYYNFMNLTANADSVAHMKSTKHMIEYLRHRDSQHSMDHHE